MRYLNALGVLTLVIVFSLVLQAGSGKAAAPEDQTGIRLADRIRIAEAYRIAEQLREELWTGWSEVPFVVLLVTPEREFLLHHPHPSDDFIPAGYDSLLECEVLTRERIFGLNFLATFPAVGGVPTVVMGLPENTGKTSTAWTVTLLHEHFHQLQNSRSGYYAAVDSLELSGGDRTGMWMLNYPFPYTSARLGEQYAQMCTRLLQALQSLDTHDCAERVTAYLQARKTLTGALDPADYRYFSFQTWQEGVARYTEYRMAKLAAEKYMPTADFQALADYTTLQSCAQSILEGTLTELEQLSLADYGRVAFYPVGAGEGLLLDQVSPGWRGHYFTEWFDLEILFRPRGE